MFMDKNNDNKTLAAEVFGENGFSLIKISDSDLDALEGLISQQFQGRIKTLYPSLYGEFKSLPLDLYHEKAQLIDHKKSWPKVSRILPKSSVEKARALNFMKFLEGEVGAFQISDEEGLGFENIYWRLVRPDSFSDVGPLHADEWFWALGHGRTPPNVKRIKVWIAINCERGKGGFRFLRGSHLKEWPYRGVMKDGIMKPEFDIPEESLGLEIFESGPGDGIVFNDKLLHGGIVGGSRTRVSIEFTMFVAE
ncbi:MAG: hypothetical protein FJW47_06780 [Actinobacteria bacterium]|nr:hypothetical protein [Actinomycetota bacterium]